MRMLFKQRLFSWFDSYDIYDEQGNTLFTVKGQLSWGHRLNIFNSNGAHIGTIQERVMTFLPKFELYQNGQYIGQIKKEFTFFVDSFVLDLNGWHIQGDLFDWNYTVVDGYNNFIMQASKEVFRLTDTYVIDVAHPNNALLALMVVLAIDAAKCSNG